MTFRNKEFILPISAATIIIIGVMIFSYFHAPAENQPDTAKHPYILLTGSSMLAGDVSDYIWVSAQYNATKVPPGNYSGLVRLVGNRYAVISDFGTPKGYYNFTIEINKKGEITDIRNNGFRNLGKDNEDEEAVAFDHNRHHIYIGNEDTSTIEEFDALNGQRLNRHAISEFVRRGISNRTIESLTYDPSADCLYTCDEGPLRGDRTDGDDSETRHRSTNRLIIPMLWTTRCRR